MSKIISKCLNASTERYGFIKPSAELAVAISDPKHGHGQRSFRLDIYSTHFTKPYYVANGRLFVRNGRTQMLMSTVHHPDSSNPFDVELLYDGVGLATHCLRHYLALIK